MRIAWLLVAILLQVISAGLFESVDAPPKLVLAIVILIVSFAIITGSKSRAESLNHL